MRGFERLDPAPGLFARAGGGTLIGNHAAPADEIPFELRQLLPKTLRLVILLRAAADPVVAATGRADEILVAPHQGRRHRPGGDDERLRLEGPEEEGEGEGNDNRFDRLPAEGEWTDHDVTGPQPGGGGDSRGIAGRRESGPILVDGHATGSGRKAGYRQTILTGGPGASV